MDAVNELKGDLGNSFRFKGNETHLVQGVGTLVSIDFKPTDEELICTIEQFNTLVQECITNFGSSVTYDEYLKELENKMDVEIDYKYTGKSNGFFTHGKIYKVSECDYEHVTNDDNADSRHVLSDDYLSKNFVKPFTQEMSDNGELPSVGMLAMVDGCKRTILLAADSEGDYVTMNDRGAYDFDGIHKIKPIDTRTDKEKLQGEINSIWNNSADKWRTIDTIVNSLVEDKLAGVKWVGK